MNRYLIYNEGQRIVEIVKTKPQRCTVGTKCKGWYNLTVWHHPHAPVASVRQAYDVFVARVSQGQYFGDVERAVDQVVQLAGKEGVYVGLGASPKLVKWRLKSLGFKVHTINVSGVKAGEARSEDLTTYLKKKLDDCARKTIVLMDFADSGITLYKLKRDIQELYPDATVRTVAIGASDQLHKRENEAYKADLDDIIADIPTLQAALYKQTLKGILGRNKAKNPYATWSAKTASALDASSEKFQAQKAALPTAMVLGKIVIPAPDQEALLTTEDPQLADAGSDAGSNAGSDVGGDADEGFQLFD